MRGVARLLLLSAIGLTVMATGPGSASSAEQSREISLVWRFPFKGGLELASSGDFVYASEWNGIYDRAEKPNKGGIHIFDVGGQTPKHVGFVHCPGYDNDVAVVRPGLIVIGYGENACAKDPRGSGVLTVDVSDPGRPRVLGSTQVFYSHTISNYPGEELIYASPGGWLPAGQQGHVDIVDVSNPRRPKVVSRFTNGNYGCHDITFDIRKSRKLAVCVNSSAEQLILDVSDPLKPLVLGRIFNPLMQYAHAAAISTDGKLLAITDEAFVGHECVSGKGPVGALWIYDISTPEAPLLVGYYGPPTGGAEPVGHLLGWLPSYCASALLDWVPGTNDLVVSWYSGGTSVLDLSNPADPREIARYDPDNSLAYGIDFYRGRIYVNDINRGLEVLEIDGIGGR